MPETTIKEERLTITDFENLVSPLVLDLDAAFNQLQDDIDKTIKKAIKNKWKPDRLIKKIGGLI